MISPHGFHAATALAALLLLVPSCANEAERSVHLGPRDGHELPPVEPARVAVGDTAPDFALRAHDGDIVALSDYRAKRDVLLVFYRGHW